MLVPGTAGSEESVGEAAGTSALTKESEGEAVLVLAEAGRAWKEQEIVDLDADSSAKRSHWSWARIDASKAVIERSWDMAHNPERACHHSGTEDSDTARSAGIGHFRTDYFRTAHSDTGHWDIDRPGIEEDTARTLVAHHSTAELHTACSSGTWDSSPDGDTETHTERGASDEDLLDLRPCRHQELHQLLPVCSAQPADGGYSSCRLGN